MNVFVTAGNTHAPIDRVRVVTNVFSGRTGASIAQTAWARGHSVTLLTSQPETASDFPPGDPRVKVVPYRTFDELAGLMQSQIRANEFDVICHSAAVSDYLSAGAYAPAPGSYFNARTRQWEERSGRPTMLEHKAGKIASREPEIWFRMVRAPKLVDRVREPWGFTGLLVKFKLEVGLSDPELIRVAEASRQQSRADLMVANTLDGAAHYAHLGPTDGRYERVARRELAERLLLTVEHLHRTRG